MAVPAITRPALLVLNKSDNELVVVTIDVKAGRSNRCKFTVDGTQALISDINNNAVGVVDVKTRAVLQRIPAGQQRVSRR